MRYTQFTNADVDQMLTTIGVDSVERLFDPVPAALRLGRPLNLPTGLSELELLRDVEDLASRNCCCDKQVCFLGGGAYDHFIPTVVDAMAAQTEFVTAYTPYQAEASQGLLQLFYEFQTMVSMLTGMDVANASLYELSTATAEAVTMAASITGRGRVVVAETIHPDTLRVLRTYEVARGIETLVIPAQNGVVDERALRSALCDNVAAVVVQSPNFFGCIERLDRIIPLVHEQGALAIVGTDPLAGGVLKRPGELDADIVVAEGQCLGIPLQYGGPYLGLLAGRESYVRKLPGRVVGVAKDANGRRGFCLVLQTREQHIRRERATSNICTNQGLLAVRAAIYMASLGRSGLTEVSRQCFDKSHYAAERISSLEGYSMGFDAPFFKEFVVRTSRDVASVLGKCKERGILGGVPLDRFDDRYSDCFLVAVTEKRTAKEIDALVNALKDA